MPLERQLSVIILSVIMLNVIASLY